MFVKFPDIEQFHNVLKSAQRNPEHVPGLITYYAKVKLHGTNAGVTITKDGQVFAQSRTRVIRPGETDNAGFAAWVQQHKDFFAGLSSPNGIVTLFGEWYGPGIQKGVACNLIDDKHFAVFAVQVMFDEDSSGMFVVDPKELNRVLSQQQIPDKLKILPIIQTFQVNLFNPSGVEKFVDQVNKLTLEVEENDPFIKTEHGADGIGEGIVLYPNLSGTRELFSNLMFKSKGEKHGNVVKKIRAPTAIAPEIVAGTNAFVEMFVTEARLEQAADRDVNNVFDIRNTGAFLKGFNQDVYKESVDELEASGLKWEDVQTAVSNTAKRWWMMKCKS